MKSITSNTLIRKGDQLTKSMICLKCPGSGIQWKDLDKIIGKNSITEINPDTTLEYKMFD